MQPRHAPSVSWRSPNTCFRQCRDTTQFDSAMEPNMGLHFRHEPLPDSTSHLRLLKILRNDIRVVCELTTWHISAAPPYHALSYTWGDEVSPCRITINGRYMVVRSNCAYVLQQAFASDRSVHYWIDAICIDQSSAEEKNHQVALMGQLYKGAAHVLACVGSTADDSDFLFSMIDKHKCLLADIIASVQVSVSGQGGTWSIANPIPHRRSLALRCFFTMTAATRRRLASAYIALVKRSYFSRVWVSQDYRT
jgi:hypothetical protein